MPGSTWSRAVLGARIGAQISAASPTAAARVPSADADTPVAVALAASPPLRSRPRPGAARRSAPLSARRSRSAASRSGRVDGGDPEPACEGLGAFVREQEFRCRQENDLEDRPHAPLVGRVEGAQ